MRFGKCEIHSLKTATISSFTTSHHPPQIPLYHFASLIISLGNYWYLKIDFHVNQWYHSVWRFCVLFLFPSTIVEINFISLCLINFFTVTSEKFPIVWIYYFLYIHSSVDGHWAILISNYSLPTNFCRKICFYLSWAYIRSGIAG